MSDAPTHEEILALERSYWEAMKAKDGARATQLSGAISLVTGARGVAAIAKARMGEMTEDGGWALHGYEFEDVQVCAPASNVAIVAYTVRQDVTMDGKRAQLHAADSSTWVKGPDGWECHAHSETFLDDKPAV